MGVITEVEKRVEEILEDVMALDVDDDDEWLDAFNEARDELMRMILVSIGPAPATIEAAVVPETVPEMPAVSDGGVKSADAWTTSFSKDKEGFIAP